MDSPVGAVSPPESAHTSGWTRRFTASEPRLSEMVALYESLGLEVRLGDATPDPGQDCLVCGPNSTVKTIYTRPLPHRRTGHGKGLSQSPDPGKRTTRLTRG